VLEIKIIALLLDVQDEEDTYRSTVVEFMENKVNKILLRIPLPATSSNLNKTFKITDIDILYKESNSTNINVIETVPISRIKMDMVEQMLMVLLLPLLL